MKIHVDSYYYMCTLIVVLYYLIISCSLAMRRRIRGILMTGKQFSLDSHLDLFHGVDMLNSVTSGATEALPTVEDSNENEENGSSSSNSGVY